MPGGGGPGRCGTKAVFYRHLTGARQTQSYEKRKPGEGMERVLVVSGSERGREFLRELLRGQEYGQGFFADNSGEARRRMAEDDFSLVIINAPLRMSRGSSWLCGRLKAPTRACCFWLKRKLRTRFPHGWRTAARWCCQSPSAGSFSASP